MSEIVFSDGALRVAESLAQQASEVPVNVSMYTANDAAAIIRGLVAERDSLRSQLRAVEAERDEARADAKVNGQIIGEVNQAIGRAGIHCAITFVEAIDQIAAERDAAVAERDEARMLHRDALIQVEDRGASYQEAVSAGHVVESIVTEQIAVWLDSCPELDAPGLQPAAAAIRAGYHKHLPSESKREG